MSIYIINGKAATGKQREGHLSTSLMLQTLPHVDTDLSFKCQLQVHRTFSAGHFYRRRNRKARVHPKPALQVYPKVRTSPL